MEKSNQDKQAFAQSKASANQDNTHDNTHDNAQLSLMPPSFQLKAIQSKTKSHEEKSKTFSLDDFSKTITSGEDPSSNLNSTQLKANTETWAPFQLKQESNSTGLPNQLKSGLEGISGFSMDDVNVHYNSDKPAQLNAHAYAQGSEIHISSGQEQHLAHEAWHVVQQKQGRVKPSVQMKGVASINDDANLEKEADVMGAKAAAGISEDDGQPNNSSESTSDHSTQNVQLASRSDAPIQRAQINANDIFSALQGTSFKQKAVNNSRDSGTATGTQITLDDILSNRNTFAQGRKGGQEKMKARVSKIITEYENKFSTGADDKTANAMKIAVTMEGIAKILADELYDLTLKPAIAKKLLDAYRGELLGGNGFKNQTANNIPEALDLAKIMVSQDPVSMFMHGELDIDLAASQIQDMAGKAGISAKAMFDLLKNKFMAEMSSYTMKEVDDMEDKAGTYSVKESTGELSTRYMKELFGDDFGGADKSGKAALKTGGGELKFTNATKSRLDNLEAKVSTVIVPSAKSKTQEHLDRVTQDDANMLVSKEVRVKAKLMSAQSGLGRALSNSEADQAINALKAYLPNVPVTITVNGFDWFGKDTNADNFNPHFLTGNSRRNKSSLNEIVGKDAVDGDDKIDYLGKWNGQSDRGDDYLRFRSWKDQKMTHNLGMEDGDLPAFGAFNVGFEKAKATEGVGNSYKTGYKAELAKTLNYNKTKRASDKADKTLADDNKNFGVNYYGDMHFKLNNNVKQRSVFTASDHGRPHTNPFLVFADFLLKDDDPTDQYDANHTKLKDSVQKAAEANRMIAAALNGPKAIGGGLPFEVQIFGGVDFTTDLEAVYVSPAVPSHIIKKMKSAFKKKGVNANIVKIKKPKGLEVLKQYGEVKNEILRILAE